MGVLVLNPGSVTLKASLISLPERTPAFERTLDWEGGTEYARGKTVSRLVEELLAGDPPAVIDGVGYRVVHGGSRFTTPTVLDDAAVAELAELAELAPLHNPVAVATIRATRRLLPETVHVASFDTAFHATLPEAARRYPVPDDWVDRAGIRRYGFHGLSVAWSTTRAAELLGRPVGDLCLVVAHLGGGCSVTAVDGGRSVDTSMGMTPLEGLMMGSRAGSIDPGIVFRLIRDGREPSAIETDLDRRSGLLGVGGTADMSRLLELEADGDERATLAVEMFVRRAAAGIAASATALPRLEAIVFTAGIGEHAAAIRARICDRLHVVGSDGEERQVDGDLMVRPSSGPAILRVRAREDLVIARDVVATIAAQGPATR